jgi:hypothetical protein
VGVFDASASPPKEWYAVTETNVFQLTQPGAFADPLTEVLRNGARTLPAQAVEAEVGLSATTVGRLNEVWSEEHGPWSTCYHFCVPRQQTHRLPAGHQPPYACTDDSRGWNRL